MTSDIPEIEICHRLKEQLMVEPEKAYELLCSRVNKALDDSRSGDAKAHIQTMLYFIKEISGWCLTSGYDLYHTFMFSAILERLPALHKEAGSPPCDHPYTYGQFRTCAVCNKDGEQCPH
ncbi:MAG: hypothetical protein PHD72_04150 [Patescibacteria group bacterium]|nr:hypothetical protein [Patescibacteria group bacterium]